MQVETAVGFVALAWLIGSFLQIARMVRKGRRLAEALALRHPETYEALGRPRPGFFLSVRRTRFAQFVGRREYGELDDGALSAEFEAYRRSEHRSVGIILALGAVIALLALGVEGCS